MKHEKQGEAATSIAVAGDRQMRAYSDEQFDLTQHGAGPVQMSDADKYRWIRANRGNFAIVDALAHSDRDADFDAQIDAAVRLWAAGRHPCRRVGD